MAKAPRRSRKPKNRKLVVIGDMQVPFQDEVEVRWALDVIADLKPDDVVVNGDLIDIEGLSPDGEAKKDYRDEMIEGCRILEDLRSVVPSKSTLYYTEGNHEQRIRRKGGRVAPYLRQALDWRNQRGCEELDHWHMSPYKFRRSAILRFGGIYVWHGKKVGANAGELEAFQVAELMGGGYDGRLYVRGHTHAPIQPRKCHRTRNIPVSLYHANHGTLCKGADMEWCESNDISGWAPGVFYAEYDEKGISWDAEVITE